MCTTTRNRVREDKKNLVLYLTSSTFVVEYIDKMISYIQIENLTKSFGDRLLFSDISLGISEGNRIGIVAQNGAGKTTLLNIIAGSEDCDSGTITLRNGIRVGYLQQSPCYPPELTVLQACFFSPNETVQVIAEYEQALLDNDTTRLNTILEQMDRLKAWDYEQRAKQILSKLNITQFDQPVGELSGGQVKRLALANVLITEPDMLILDEPTNHLDIEMTEWLEEYLNRGNTTLLMVTHDRYFLDRVCNEIIEIDNHTIYSYKGNFSYYLEKRQERLDVQNAETARARNLLRTELDWMRRQPQARGTKAKARVDAFYDLEAKARRRIDDGPVKLDVKATYIGSKIFEAQYISKSFDQVKILDNFYYNFARYEKMGIIGQNGTGKSTFVKMLIGEATPDSGRFDIGETVRFGYYSQDGLQFKEGMKVIDAVREIAEEISLGDGRRLSASQFLQHFLFTPEKQHNYIHKLSGGEKRRLHLCTVLMRNPNFLVLDEPTNDLDITTLSVLEEYLSGFKGCVIVVSHDRYFMDKVVDHLLVFQGNAQIKDFPGNYTDYREWRDIQRQEERKQAEEQRRKQAQEIPTKPKREQASERRRLSFKERKELEELDVIVPQLEAEKSRLEEEMCSGTLSTEQLLSHSRRIEELITEIDEKGMRWLELSEWA